MTVDEAVNIAWGLGRNLGEPRPDARQALAEIEEKLATCGHTWITGEMARNVLKAELERS
jgi:hypothetical protein